MNEPYKEDFYKGFHIKIEYDDCDESPREWDNLGTLMSWHSRYTFERKDFPRGHAYDDLNLTQRNWARNYPPTSGVTIWQEDKYPYIPYLIEFDFAVSASFAAWLDFMGNKVISLAVFMYEHSGIALSTRSFMGRAHHAEWDSGQIGWIYVLTDEVLEEWGWKRLTPKRREKIEGILQQEIKSLNDYVQGNVFGWIVEDTHGEHIDSCWGYIGDADFALSEAKNAVDSIAERILAEKREKELQQIQEQIVRNQRLIFFKALIDNFPV